MCFACIFYIFALKFFLPIPFAPPPFLMLVPLLGCVRGGGGGGKVFFFFLLVGPMVYLVCVEGGGQWWAVIHGAVPGADPGGPGPPKKKRGERERKEKKKKRGKRKRDIKKLRCHNLFFCAYIGLH